MLTLSQIMIEMVVYTIFMEKIMNKFVLRACVSALFLSSVFVSGVAFTASSSSDTEAGAALPLPPLPTGDKPADKAADKSADVASDKEASTTSAAPKATSDKVINDDTVVAEYSGNKVKASEIMAQFQAAIDPSSPFFDKKFGDLDKSLQVQFVQTYIHLKLIDKEVASANIESSKDYQARLTQLKIELARQLFLDKYVQDHTTDNMIQAEYDKYKLSLSGKDEVKVRHILVDSEAKAKEVKQALAKKGARFEDVAKEYSLDESAKTNGGELGYIAQGQMVPEFDKQAFSMKVGDISEPVQTQFGWHIINVEDKRPAKVGSFEDVKPALQNRLKRAVMDQLLADLSKKSGMKVLIADDSATVAAPVAEDKAAPAAEAKPATETKAAADTKPAASSSDPKSSDTAKK